MSKKRNKSIPPATGGAQKWEQELISINLCDDVSVFY